jgi:hypothetical protein
MDSVSNHCKVYSPCSLGNKLRSACAAMSALVLALTSFAFDSPPFPFPSLNRFRPRVLCPPRPHLASGPVTRAPPSPNGPSHWMCQVFSFPFSSAFHFLFRLRPLVHPPSSLRLFHFVSTLPRFAFARRCVQYIYFVSLSLPRARQRVGCTKFSHRYLTSSSYRGI